MITLGAATTHTWVDAVLASFDVFLQDHAANERKVATSALDLAAKHPRRPALVKAMIALTQEELGHFRDVHRVLAARGQPLGDDRPDPYMGALRRSLRSESDVDALLLGKLLLFAVIEARGHERFALVANAHPDPAMRRFYGALAHGEARHHEVYLRLARRELPSPDIDERLEAIIAAEAEVITALPVGPGLFSGTGSS